MMEEMQQSREQLTYSYSDITGFDRKGICSKSKNQKDFREMQQKINGMGYTTLDLS